VSAARAPHGGEVLARARHWLDQDPDPQTRAELQELIAASATEAGLAALAARFTGRLAFGTAGLRGELGAGPLRMNRVLVSQSAVGLARYLRSRSPERTPSVVIGYDGRKNSRIFAEDTAELMAGAGIRAILLPRLLPTPVLAFAVRHLGCDAGVMVTASHNPARDNGYKVYLGGEDQGSQIVGPADSQIAACILEVAETERVPALPRDRCELADDEVVDAYVRATASVSRGVTGDLSWTYTAMHGVGWDTLRQVLDAAGLPQPTIVAEQIAPDPDFPTVAFPNPEEPGALDLAVATARASAAELIVASDPDADRLAVAIPDDSAAGGWRRLSGNEVGILLGARTADRLRASGGTGVLACSLVSTPALRAIAEGAGLGFTETLTGFKWISRTPGLSFGFEEALGYLVNPGTVRDKDGLSAAVDFLAMVLELKAAGRSVADRLRELDGRIGAFASSQVSARFDGIAEVPRIMARIRSALPTELGGHPVESVDDFQNGFGPFPPNDILRLWLAGGSRVIIRPSGTEPKLKVYIDAVSTVGDAAGRRVSAEAVVAELAAAVRPLLTPA